MVTRKGSTKKPTKKSTKKPTKKPTKPEQGGDMMTAGQEPIIITGGSVILQYADIPGDEFIDDPYTPPFKRGMKRLINKLNGSEKSVLTSVEITDEMDNVLLEIDLNALKLRKDFKIKVYYKPAS